MNMKCIKPKDHFYVVDDSDVTKHIKPCYCYNSIKKTFDEDIILYQGVMPMYHYIGFKKILYSSEKLEGVKHIPKSEFEKGIFGYSVEELAELQVEIEGWRN